MKKLYGPKPTKRIHPASPPSPSSTLLSSLPAALLALAAALSPHDQETLAYLLGCERPSQTNKQQQQRGRRRQRQQNHPPELGCSCFGCYTSFWARWDSSPNRHVIHLIIDAFEETLELSKSKDRGNKGRNKKKKDEEEVAIEENSVGNEVGHEQVDDDDHNDGDDDGDDDEEEEEVEDGEGKSSVRRFVSWIFGMNE